MTKVKNNAAEIIITIMTIICLLSSCSNHYTCPSYAGVTEAEVGDMYANQKWSIND
tara:strand:+ start:306 stop:473 length:168 start_codon:yes stop_codon:yes gene_type:complete